MTNLIKFIAICAFTCFPAYNAAGNWYDGFLFKDPSFNFEFIRTIGYTYEKGADIGESVATAKQISDGDFDSWYTAWTDTANRIQRLADSAQAKGNDVTAREAFFRATNYYRTAGFYMLTPERRSKSIASYRYSKNAFLKAIKALSYVEVVNIPYEKTTLQAYLIRSDKKNAPIVIVNTGFDGTKEELYFEIGAALHSRGYNALLLEGPGQGNVLRKQQLPFRPDWEKVVTPVVDYVETLPNINKNKIALVGISMGGYLAPRAAAFEPRIKALIANGGVYDLAATIYKTLPPEMISLIDKNPEKFNKMIAEAMKNSSMVRWYYENGMWSFQVKTPAEFMKKIKMYTLKNIAEKIRTNTLIIDSEEDSFMKGQAKTLYDHISGPKTYLLFTKAEAAQSHCQMGAIAISNERILDWLDSVFLRRSV